MSDESRIVVLGNSFAAKVQLPALRWVGGNRVVGLAGRDRAKAEATAAAFGIEHATDDWRELLDLEPELVLVSTPVHLHREMTLAALARGCAVLCEKPFALDAGEAREMLAAAEGRAAWIDHQLRWSPHLRRMRERLAAGFVGEPWHARIEMLLPPTGFLDRPWRWWFDAERGGGILGALGSHLLDLLRWLWGDVTAVRAELRAFASTRVDADGASRPVTADEYAALSLRFANGSVGELVTSIALPADPTFFLQLTGRAGTLRLVDGETLEAGAQGEPLEPVAVEPRLPPASAFGMEDHGIFARCLPLYLRDVLACVRRGRTSLPEAPSFLDGLAVQRILDAARASASSSTGGWERP